MRVSKVLWIIFIFVCANSPTWSWGREGHDHSNEKGAHDDHGHEDKGHQDHADEHGDEHEEGHADGPIELSEESQELGGIQTEKVKSSALTQKVSVLGRVAQDVENVEYVLSAQDGAIKKLNVGIGDAVKKDQILAILQSHKGDSEIELKAPISGIIISEFVRVKEHVDLTTAIYAIADMSRLTANFDVYEKDIGQIQQDQRILIYPLAYQDKAFKGRIVFISPRVDETTYTVKIKAEVNNSGNLLKLGMAVRGEILVEGNESGVVIPAQAVQTVEGKTVVFKKTEEGFEPQEVSIQSQTKDSIAISDGLSQGDEIVVKGSFILKSKMLESEMEHAHSH